ncbi:MAG: Sensor histidine kinase TmoS [candidate division BRC1 bacterium ADurb.BinA364]|nr:MAG: Sensor histidine kinase TmoS [candidate division BRC1 bacterium ADurb.BinA364]
MLVLAGALFELDRQHYQSAKRNIIFMAQGELFPHLNDDVRTAAALDYLLASDEEGRGRSKDALLAMFRKIVSRQDSVFRARLLDESRQVIDGLEIDRPEKRKQCNTFRNCLFLRDFEGSVTTTIEPLDGRSEGESKPLGWIQISWTTPPDNEDIRALTRRYRVYAAETAGIITLIFAAIAWLVIFPLRRVQGAIEESIRRRPTPLSQPYSRLERAYNDLARDALLTRLRSEIPEMINNAAPIPDESQLFAALADRVSQLFGFPFVSLSGDIADKSDSPGAPTPQFRLIRTKSKTPGESRLQDFESKHAGTPGAAGEGDLPESDLRFFTAGVAAPSIESPHEKSEIARLTIGVNRKSWRLDPRWPGETARGLADEIGKALEALRLRNASVFRERSEATIHLAENLGHDLTNVIAANKLDLMTLNQILEAWRARPADAARLGEMMGESVERLLAGARLQQEIVDIYRSFIRLKRPKYELTCLNSLIRDIATLFESTTTARIRIALDLPAAPLQAIVEPRLIKLAIFNLLSNAASAIKEAQAQGRGEGRIWIFASRDDSNGQAAIRIRDNGAGIRDPDGGLAPPERIAQIFGLGYTTKKSTFGSGLGLNWTQNIVVRLHGGRIAASNSPEGGAEFQIWLPMRRADESNSD